jgi:hypothetical protein
MMQVLNTSLPGVPKSAGGTFDTSIKSWLSAMSKASKIKPGGKLVFLNKKTGSAVPMSNAAIGGGSIG